MDAWFFLQVQLSGLLRCPANRMLVPLFFPFSIRNVVFNSISFLEGGRLLLLRHNARLFFCPSPAFSSLSAAFLSFRRYTALSRSPCSEGLSLVLYVTMIGFFFSPTVSTRSPFLGMTGSAFFLSFCAEGARLVRR